MIKKLFLFLLLMQPLALAEITVKVTPASVTVKEQITKVSQLVNKEGEAIGSPTSVTGPFMDKGEAPAAVINVSSDDTSSDKLLMMVFSGTASVADQGEGVYAIYESGTHECIVQTINLESLKWEYKRVIVTVGKPTPPEPPKPPVPPVPGDEFNNLGQRVAEWTAGLPYNKELAVVYSRAVDRLISDPTATITAISADMNNDSLTVRKGNTNYNSFISGINTELQSRWPMARGTYADFLTCIVKGLQ